MNPSDRRLYLTFRALSRLARALPLPVALAAGRAFADGLWAVYRCTGHRGYVEGHVEAAGLAQGRDAVRIARDSVRQVVASIVEVLRLPGFTAADADRLVRFEGREHLDRALAEGRGVVMATAHFGNWELMGATLARTGYAVCALQQPPSQPAFDRLFEEFRTAVGVQGFPNRGPASLRPVLRHLRANGILGLVADQHGEAQEAIATFFGHPVSVPLGPFFFAERTGAVLLPMAMIRRRGGRHVLRVEPPIPVTGDPDRDAKALVATYERWIRAHPDHWLWIHDRFAREGELTRGPRASAPEPA